MTKLPAPCIGLRRAKRVTGEPYLHGVVPRDFEAKAGMRVQLRKLRDAAHEDCGATHAIIFAPETDETTTGAAIDQATRDSAWHRDDPRDQDPERSAP